MAHVYSILYAWWAMVVSLGLFTLITHTTIILNRMWARKLCSLCNNVSGKFVSFLHLVRSPMHLSVSQPHQEAILHMRYFCFPHLILHLFLLSVRKKRKWEWCVVAILDKFIEILTYFMGRWRKSWHLCFFLTPQICFSWIMHYNINYFLCNGT